MGSTTGSYGTGRVSTRCARPPLALRPCRVTRRPSLRSESSYGPCGPPWTMTSRPSTEASRRTRIQQSARELAVRGPRSAGGGRERGGSWLGTDRPGTIPLPTPVSGDSHTFRATGITAYLSNGGTLEHAQRIACHASPKTTKLYDRTADTISHLCREPRTQVRAGGAAGVTDVGEREGPTDEQLPASVREQPWSRMMGERRSMKASEFDRMPIAGHWRDCVRISREEVFGSADEKYAPRHLQDDAATIAGSDRCPRFG